MIKNTTVKLECFEVLKLFEVGSSHHTNAHNSNQKEAHWNFFESKVQCFTKGDRKGETK